MKKLDNYGSAIPVVIFILGLAVTSVFVLISGEIVEPIINWMPDCALRNFFVIMFPGGFMLGVFFALTYALYLRMQKKNYYEGGPL